jgi:ketosteroid isomerase-like protein
MSEEANVQAAQAGYAAFGRGDMPAILEMLADDVEWVDPGPADVLPTAGTHRGKDAVLAWFGALGGNVDFEVFEPREFIAQGDKVVALIHAEATIRNTGKKMVQDEAHVWTFRDGKVARLQLYLDTAAMVSAWS